MVQSVTALDDYRVEFKLKEPFGSFPIQLVMPVVPAGGGDSLRTYPIGTGPYRFVSYAVDEQVEFGAFMGDAGAGDQLNGGVFENFGFAGCLMGIGKAAGKIGAILFDRFVIADQFGSGVQQGFCLPENV